MYLIKDTCVGCHNCAMECPAKAIHYVGRQYQIDQQTCIGCGHCEQVCHIHAAYNTEVPPPLTHAPIHKKCDIVVCGGGTGLIAAFKAAQLGKKVILLEKADKLGGNSDFAHGFFAVYTKWHEAAGLEDLREAAVEHFMKAADYELDEAVVRTAVYGCGEFFDWLCQQGDMEEYYKLERRPLMPGAPPLAFGNGQITNKKRVFENLKCRDCAIGPGWGYTVIKHVLLEQIEQQGLDLEILTATEAKHLLTREDGSVCGVLAQDPGGTVEVNAEAVILATGGFGRSKEKLQKYFHLFDCGTPPHIFTVPTDTGDAIDMLQELGVEPDPQRMFTPHLGGPSHHPYSFALNMLLSNPMGIQLNLSGKRWRNEAAMGVECPEFSQQPNQVCWSIFTKDMLDEIILDTKLHNPMLADEPEIMDHTWEEIEEEMNMPVDAAPGPVVRMADSIPELAVKLGMDADAVTAEVARYNAFCAAGEDQAFHKPAPFLRPLEKGPFYAIYGQRFIEMAAGGLRVNGALEVLREDGSVIRGLYGVGDATSAIQRRYKYAVISELTWAVASAYRSAIEAVKALE